MHLNKNLILLVTKISFFFMWARLWSLGLNSVQIPLYMISVHCHLLARLLWTLTNNYNQTSNDQDE